MAEEELMSFSRRIATLRKLKSLTQQDLADALGVSRVTVTYWERGIAVPDLKNYRKLCIALDIPMQNSLMVRSWQKAKADRKKL